ncbi:MAG: ABC transporter substrate-binding protein [Candidatus Magnetomorum sp.]|nr:ABC transporter substrate-binding protein [Candidatus Magnetomorum sp.]
MKKIMTIIVFCFFVTTAYAEDNEIVVFRVGYLPLLSQLPIVVSYENDRLNLKKIQVELIKFKSCTSIEAALRVGAIHAANVSIPIVLSIASEMYDCKICNIKVVGVIQKGGTLLVAREQLNLNDFRGKLIGVPGLDSVETFTLMNIMQENGLNFGLDYKAIGITYDSAIEDLKTDKLQAFYLPEPWGSIAEKEAGAFSIDAQTFSIDQPTTLLILSKEFMENNTEAVAEWIESIFNACLFIENDINKTGARQTAIIQKKYFNFSNDLVIDSLANRKGAIGFAPSLPDMDHIKSILTKATEIKWIMKSVPFDQIIDTAVMEKLIKQP